MTDSQTLLTEYARNGSDTAFQDLVTRYIDLVYSTALRLVEGDTHRAEDVAQSVFVDLARKAKTLPKDVSLGGWLHRATCLAAGHTIRGERRRQNREKEAVEMTLQNTQADFSQIAPILDEAINELEEADRAAILLRFFEQHDFRTVGQVLGSNEDAARMRVNRALEKLEIMLKRRGVTAGSVTLGVLLGTNAVQAAPVGLALTISTAAIGGTTLTAAATKTIVMTTLQKTLLSALVIVSISTPMMFQRHAHATLRAQDEAIRQRENQIVELQRTSATLSRKVAEAKSIQAVSNQKFRELLRLRGELGRLRSEVQETAHSKTTLPRSREEILTSLATTHSERVRQLKQSLESNPVEKIPELKLLTEKEWLWLTGTPEFDPENGYQAVMSKARGHAENNFVNTLLQPALQKYIKDHGQFPIDLLHLKAYFKSPVDDAILHRWEIVPANELADYMVAQALGKGDDRLIAPKAAVNLALDMPTVCGLNKVTAFGSRPTNQWVRAY